MMAGKAEPRTPVKPSHLDVRASGFSDHLGVSVGTIIDDAELSSRTKDPDGLSQGLGALVRVLDVVEGQAADHRVKRLGGERKVSSVSVRELDTLAYSLGSGVPLGRGSVVSCLIPQAPDVDTRHSTLGYAMSSCNEHGASTAADVEHTLVATKVELVEQLLPD